jgi:hypothetical protein
MLTCCDRLPCRAVDWMGRCRAVPRLGNGACTSGKAERCTGHPGSRPSFPVRRKPFVQISRSFCTGRTSAQHFSRSVASRPRYGKVPVAKPSATGTVRYHSALFARWSVRLLQACLAKAIPDCYVPSDDFCTRRTVRKTCRPGAELGREQQELCLSTDAASHGAVSDRGARLKGRAR